LDRAHAPGVTAIDYSIWSCCFARGMLPADFMGGTPIASNGGTVETPMLYTVLAASAPRKPKLVLVDTGFKDGISMTGRPFDDFERPPAVLAKLGFTPEDVDLVVLTHLHFDHAGNFDAFPNAEIVVQRREYEQWKAVLATVPDPSAGKTTWALSSLDVALFARLDRAVAERRLRLLDGDGELAPGLAYRLAADSHTFGSQWLEVTTPDGAFAIAGDCAYRYVNIERMWPPAYIQGNPWNMLATFRRMLDAVDGRVDRIIPGHDMEIFKRFPSWIDGGNPIAEIHLAAGDRSRRR
jgi:glyoxylase-like metal-dependent hydrolase (beta-lactamase superfamily II)